MLSGQHKLAAVEMVRQDLNKQGLPIPDWAQVFDCQVVKANVDLATRQLIAGVEQSRAGVTKALTMGEKLEWLGRKLDTDYPPVPGQEATERYRDVEKVKLLAAAYQCTGCTEAQDGAKVVCFMMLYGACLNVCSMMMLWLEGQMCE